MKIKLAILERDKNYLMRVVSTFGTKYSEKFEIYSFTDPDVAIGILSSAKIDVLLAGDSFDIDVSKLPNRCAFAYLVDSVGIETVSGQKAICKFQKADLIYKQIISVYSEKASDITGFKVADPDCKVILFCSPSGGNGCSTMAAACAVRYAQMNKKVMYLNLEKFGAADVFFSGQGQFDMSDIIFALKSKKTNLPLKLESCIKQDDRGVFFYSQAKLALDMMELNTEDILRLLSELQVMGEYDYIIVDTDFSIEKDALEIYRKVHTIVLVGNGSVESNTKTQRAIAALATKEQNAESPLTNRMVFAYNKVSSKNGHTLNISGLKIIGGAPRYSGGDTRDVVDQLAKMDIFDAIM